MNSSFPYIERDTALTLLTASIVLFGLMGSLLPIIPGTVIIWAGVLLHKILMPEAFGWGTVIVLGVLMLIAQLLDYVCSYYGAKRFGATWKGGLGAFLGVFIGPIVLSPIPGIGILAGLFLGPVIGAVLGEMAAGRDLRAGGRAGMGTVVGGLAAFVLKFGIACGMSVYFAAAVLMA